GYPVAFRLEYAVREQIEDAAFEVFLHSADWGQVCHLTTELSDDPLQLEPGVGTVDFYAAELGLQPGIYRVSATIIHRGQPPGNAIDYREEFATLIVEPGKSVRGSFYMPYEWNVETH